MLKIYGHRLTKQDHETIKRMMKAIGLEEYKVIDLMSQSAEEGPCITIGTIANRKISGQLHSFPDFTQFTGKLDPAKKELRKQIFDSLKNIANQLKSGPIVQAIAKVQLEEKIFERPHTLEEFKRMWQSSDLSYIIVNSADEKICIYNGDKPDIDAHSFYSVPEFACLLDLMDIFGARNLLIFRKGDEKGHVI